MRKPYDLPVFNRALTCWFFFFHRTPASFRAQDGPALGMNLVDAVQKAVLCSTPASLPAEVGTCVADEAGDRGEAGAVLMLCAAACCPGERDFLPGCAADFLGDAR